MATAWIDFKELRAKLDFGKMLRAHGVHGKVERGQLKVRCPLPAHRDASATPTFSANLEKGVFHCFGCGAKGNVLDFAVLMEGGNPRNGEDLRRTALKLHAELSPDPLPPTAPQKRVVVNAPLDFELRQLDDRHPYFGENDIAPETVEYFGLGYCSRGMLAGCIALPLHSQEAQLVGYAGLPLKLGGTYRFPTTRERQGVIHEFQRSLLLYNAHRIVEPCEDLVVVDDIPLVWWLHGNRIPDAVALLDCTCSPEQARQIVERVGPAGVIWIFSDSAKEALPVPKASRQSEEAKLLGKQYERDG